jgi:branched-chain amino acid transport system substrate-binding protein
VIVADKLDDSNPIKKVAVEYKNEYEKAFNSQVSSFGGHAYDALYAIVNAMKAAKSEDPSKIRDAIEQTKGFAGIDGVVNMSATDHLGLDTESGMVLIEIKGGDWNIVK